MLNNVSGEVSVTWEEKSITKPLPSAIIQMALIILVSVIFTAIIGFVFLGLSVTGVFALIVLSTGGLAAAVYFGRDFLLEMFFKEGKQSQHQQEHTSHQSSAESAPQEVSSEEPQAKVEA